MHFAASSTFNPQFRAVEGTVTLTEDISALEMVPTDAGTRLGRIMLVPKGAALEISGSGFNDRTVQARYAGRLCFVFLRDLESSSVNGVLQH